MLTIKSKALLTIVAGLFFCLLFVACTQKNNSDNSSDNKILIRGNGPDPESLDPQLVRSESAQNIVRDLYEGLLTEAEDGSLASGVAQTWSYDPQNLCYQFQLKKNAKWSNAETVTAQDFKRGLEFALDATNASPYRELLALINVIEVIDNHKLELCTEYTVPYFLELLVLPVSFPRHAGAGKKRQIFNGAYQLRDWIPQDKVVLTKNPNFHSASSVYFNQVEYITTEDAGSELKRFLAGELDVTATVPPSDVKRLQQSHLDSLKIAPVLNSYFYGFNLSKPPFKDNPKLRQALSLSIDREILANKILGTGEKPAWTLVPPGIRGHVSPEIAASDLTAQQRLDLARQLYSESGYTKTNPLKFQLRYNTSPVHKKIAITLASMWKETLGVEVDLYNEEWKVFVENRRNKNTEMFRSGWIADVNDASNYLDLFQSLHPLNDYAYFSSRYDELLEMAKTASSKRPSILRAAEEQLLKDHAVIPLYFYVSKHMVSSRLDGWEANALDHHASRYLKLKENNQY